MYEQGVAPALAGTPLGQGASMGVHESQSRLWENVVGRSRDAWEHYFPKLQRVFPDQLGNASLQRFYCAINKVEKTLIRTEADELTYFVHHDADSLPIDNHMEQISAGLESLVARDRGICPGA